MSYRILEQNAAIGTPHTNTTTENKIGRKTFYGYELQAGKMFKILGAARASAENSSDTVTMAVRFGTTSATPASNTLLGSSAAVDTVADDVAIVDLTVHVRADGKLLIFGYVSDCDAVGQKLLYTVCSQPITIDSTATYYLDWTADWSAASTSNVIAAESFVVIEIV